MESVGKPGSVSIDETNTIPPEQRCEMQTNLYGRTGLWSVERSTRMSRERTCPEHGRCAGLDCAPRHRAGGGEPIDK